MKTDSKSNITEMKGQKKDDYDYLKGTDDRMKTLHYRFNRKNMGDNIQREVIDNKVHNR